MTEAEIMAEAAALRRRLFATITDVGAAPEVNLLALTMMAGTLVGCMSHVDGVGPEALLARVHRLLAHAAGEVLGREAARHGALAVAIPAGRA